MFIKPQPKKVLKKSNSSFIKPIQFEKSILLSLSELNENIVEQSKAQNIKLT